jgi:hypothetical protein
MLQERSHRMPTCTIGPMPTHQITITMSKLNFRIFEGQCIKCNTHKVGASCAVVNTTSVLKNKTHKYLRWSLTIKNKQQNLDYIIRNLYRWIHIETYFLTMLISYKQYLYIKNNFYSNKKHEKQWHFILWNRVHLWLLQDGTRPQGRWAWSLREPRTSSGRDQQRGGQVVAGIGRAEPVAFVYKVRLFRWHLLFSQ